MTEPGYVGVPLPDAAATGVSVTPPVAPANDFAPPVLPKANNVHGLPQPPSGLHPVNNVDTQIIMAGHDGANLPSVPVGAGSSVGAVPNPPGLRSRLAAIFRRG
jgi:hypothetical protein